MGNRIGTYLGGIRTIEDVRLRCRIDEETGCWIWGLCKYKDMPIATVTVDGKRETMTGRRAVATLKAGKKPSKDKFVFASKKCHQKHCVNPDHIRIGSRLDHGEYLRRTGQSKSERKLAACRSNIRKTRAKLSIEAARNIRGSDESAIELAKKYGVDVSSIRKVRLGQTWREHTSGASVFSWNPTQLGSITK